MKKKHKRVRTTFPLLSSSTFSLKRRSIPVGKPKSLAHSSSSSISSRKKLDTTCKKSSKRPKRRNRRQKQKRNHNPPPSKMLLPKLAQSKRIKGSRDSKNRSHLLQSFDPLLTRSKKSLKSQKNPMKVLNQSQLLEKFKPLRQHQLNQNQI